MGFKRIHHAELFRNFIILHLNFHHLDNPKGKGYLETAKYFKIEK
jgi:hypothetical protein